MIETNLQRLEQLNKEHIGEGKAVSGAFGGALYPFDLLTFGVLNRSMSLVSGFVTLMRADNYLAATTLVRPQLDTFLRYAAGWLVAKPHDFAMEILKGTPVRKQKTMDGCLMTDRFLVDHFKTEHPWIESVYEASSGFVHLSERHLCMNVIGTDEDTVTFSISDNHFYVPDEIRLEAIAGFTEITELILQRVCGWRYTKENSGKTGTEGKNGIL